MIELGRSTWEGIYGYQVSTVDEKKSRNVEWDYP